MTTRAYNKEITALLVIDPYNDFISEGGKAWPRIRAVAEANGCVPHMLRVLNAAREAKLRVFYAPHRRYRPGDYETWKDIAPVQKAAWERKTFEYGTWGGEFHPGFEPRPGEIVAAEHRCSSGFANTDLGLQLKKTASSSSSSWGLLRIRASNRPFALLLSLATGSRWYGTQQRITRTSRCMPPSTSISRDTPVPW
jgi:hypothetical protein